MTTETANNLMRENEELRRRLEEMEETVRALRAGEVDAVVIENGREQVYTLEQADRPYQLLVTQLPNAAAVLSVDGRILVCNRRFAELLDYPVNSLVDHPLRDFAAPDSWSALDSLLRDGRIIPVQDTITLLPDAREPVSIHVGITCLRGGALGQCLLLTDVTERRHYEELQRTQSALRASEARLALELADTQLLHRISAELIREDEEAALYQQIVDVASTLAHSDFASLQMFLPERGELELLAFKGFHPDSAAFWKVLKANSGTVCGEAMRVHRRIIVRDVEGCEISKIGPNLLHYRLCGIRAVQSTPLVSRSGQLIGMISTHWRNPHEPVERELRLFDVLARLAADLIERKRSANSTAHLSAIVDTTDDAIISKDLSGTITSWNKSAERLFGYSAAEAVGQSVLMLIPKDRRDEEVEIIARLKRGERVDHFDTVRVRKDGTQVDVSLTISPIRDRQGRIVGASKIARDVTDRKKVEEALREADRKKDEFLATLAHELRGPLAPMRNAVQILMSSGPPAPELQSARGVIDRQLQIMTRLLEDLLDVTRISRNKLELRTTPVQLSAVIDSALETSRPVIEGAKHSLAVELPPEPIHLDGDSVRLAQVFSNLLTNAAKYTEDGGRICLSATRQGNDVVVSVKDSGIGIPPEMLPRVFEIFSQSPRALERAQGGLGIGLSLVKGLVELHGGRVSAKSEGAGRGSEFVVLLPISSSTPTADSRADSRRSKGAEKPPTSPPRRILVVDDNVDSADTLTQLLSILGHEVSTAYDGEAAAAAAEAMLPDVVLLDIGMPKLDGYEACRRIRNSEWGKKMFLIALTGWGQAEDRARTREAGFNHHLVKPVEAATLMKLLASVPV